MAGATASRDAASDWEAVRGAADIQYAPLPKVPAPPVHMPGWLRVLGEWLEALLGPIGRLLGISWPVFQYVLIGLAVLLVLFVLWRLLGPLLQRPAKSAEDPAEAWLPDRDEAMALLGDADRLAAEGRFAEATHLLLRRSVQQIRATRPEWLHPASTAREIATLPALPETGRNAFATIAQRVERSRFALRDLNAQDWAAARGAYAEFAQIRFTV
ncbi:hypothetical protein EDF56_104306 [Novosphingobium sp. PhB165]|uniref:hypothetical protein n=1 Tax=Novosphingobium sp. PhB165 TaxID=2485105 RepID=UPI0010506A05|nr:hypothetical protein [Novosphingobium sp. PhB165]TCM18773.1 hypothetical protein EDF56_104306 [Novosphingobium sp. PhB165]